MDSDLIKGYHFKGNMLQIWRKYILRRRPYFAPKIQIELIPFQTILGTNSLKSFTRVYLILFRRGMVIVEDQSGASQRTNLICSFPSSNFSLFTQMQAAFQHHSHIIYCTFLQNFLWVFDFFIQFLLNIECALMMMIHLKKTASQIGFDPALSR